MTRGTLMIVLPEGKLAASCEFNGDMYEGGHYEDAVLALSGANDLDSFVEAIDEFDREHHNYREKDAEYEDEEPLKVYDFTLPEDQRSKDRYLGVRLYNQKDFENASGYMRTDVMLKTINYSDYFFIRNASGSTVTVDAYSDIEIPDGVIATFCFGDYLKMFDGRQDVEKLKVRLEANRIEVEGE